MAYLIHKCATVEFNEIEVRHLIDTALGGGSERSSKASSVFWGMVAVRYHLHYRYDVANALRTFRLYFKIEHILPRELYHALHRVHGLKETFESREEKLENCEGLFLPLLPAVPVSPPPDAIALLWSIALSSRHLFSRLWRTLYDQFRRGNVHPRPALDGDVTHLELPYQELQRTHSASPASSDETNIYIHSLPPRYRPSAEQFNVFLKPITQGRRLKMGNGVALRSQAYALRLMRDMRTAGVQPTLFTYWRVALACAHARDWNRVTQILDKLAQLGFSRWKGHGADEARAVVFGSIQQALRQRGLGRQAEKMAEWYKAGQLGTPFEWQGGKDGRALRPRQRRT